MSFEPSPSGTRGGRQPGGRFYLWMSKLIIKLVRRRGTVMGGNALVLTTIGRKSGERRTSALGWFPGPDGSWLIVASAAGGPRQPGWYYNIAAHPDQIEIEVGGQTIAVMGEQLRGAARDEAWKQIAAASPQYTKYEHRTDREIPIIRLVKSHA